MTRIDEAAFRDERSAVLTGAKLLYWSRWPHYSHGQHPPASEEEHSARMALRAMELTYDTPNVQDRNYTSAEIFDMALVRFNAAMDKAVRR
ncbi:MAG: hypothetical protein HY517_04975 [Candidatus Aenigmarchaeota archaeon]|nr:hypothetical protein [Candidatus Aenigmarchaeota archaeon]